MSFSPGDVVRLKSGGPHMTVGPPTLTTGDNESACKWFDAKGELKFASFDNSSLVKVEDTSSSFQAIRKTR